MCTRARLVQGASGSDWYGMPHGKPEPIAFELRGGQPAYLQVTVDPAAHGEAGLGPIKRGVRLATNGGQTVDFLLSATVTPGKLSFVR